MHHHQQMIQQHSSSHHHRHSLKGNNDPSSLHHHHHLVSDPSHLQSQHLSHVGEVKEEPYTGGGGDVHSMMLVGEEGGRRPDVDNNNNNNNSSNMHSIDSILDAESLRDNHISHTSTSSSGEIANSLHQQQQMNSNGINQLNNLPADPSPLLGDEVDAAQGGPNRIPLGPQSPSNGDGNSVGDKSAERQQMEINNQPNNDVAPSMMEGLDTLRVGGNHLHTGSQARSNGEGNNHIVGDNNKIGEQLQHMDGHGMNQQQQQQQQQHINAPPFMIKNEIMTDGDLSNSANTNSGLLVGGGHLNHLHSGMTMDMSLQHGGGYMHHHGLGDIQSHHSQQMQMNPHLYGQPSHLHPHHMHSHLLHHDLSGDPRQLHYSGLNAGGVSDCLTTQKAVAFLAGPRERIHVLGNPVEYCPRCQQEGLGSTSWRPHRHIGELKIRYICERHFDDLESNHHFDIPLCPICNQVLYLYDFNNMLGVSNARRLHKYVLKCANRHVLPLLDLFCQTKKGGERCNANFKLQWCYGTMVKRCEAQKNRDHDLWWVRYKNEWKQRRTIIRYKKDFLSHLTDAQRSLLLGLGLEGEPPPDPKTALGPTFDALVSSAGGSPNGPKIKKRAAERGSAMGQLGSHGNMQGGSIMDAYDLNPSKRRHHSGNDINVMGGAYGRHGHMGIGGMSPVLHHLGIGGYGGHVSKHGHGGGMGGFEHHHHQQQLMNQQSGELDIKSGESLGGDTARQTDHSNDSGDDGGGGGGERSVMGTIVQPNRTPEELQLMMMYSQGQHSSHLHHQLQQQGLINGYQQQSAQQQMFGQDGMMGFPPAHMIITGTPTPPLPNSVNGSPVTVSVIGEVVVTPQQGPVSLGPPLGMLGGGMGEGDNNNNRGAADGASELQHDGDGGDRRRGDDGGDELQHSSGEGGGGEVTNSESGARLRDGDKDVNNNNGDAGEGGNDRTVDEDGNGLERNELTVREREGGNGKGLHETNVGADDRINNNNMLT